MTQSSLQIGHSPNVFMGERDNTKSDMYSKFTNDELQE